MMINPRPYMMMILMTTMTKPTMMINLRPYMMLLMTTVMTPTMMINPRPYMMIILMTTMTKPTMMINLRPYVQLSTDQAETMETLGPRLHWAARLIVFFHLFCLHFANFSSAFLPCISFVLSLFSDLWILKMEAFRPCLHCYTMSHASYFASISIFCHICLPNVLVNFLG